MSNQNLTPYVFEDELVRVHQDENGDPWFVAKDVCRVLGIANSKDAVSRLDDDERAGVGITDLSSNGVEQKRTFTVVSESGLYSLVFRSNKPEAKAFRKWVTSEILPALRKTGRYEVPPADPTEKMDELKDLAKSVPLRPAQRVQMMTLAVRVCRDEGVSNERAVLARYVSLCEVVSGPHYTDQELSGMAATENVPGLVKAFIAEMLIVTHGIGAGYRTSAKELYLGFSRWCSSRGIPDDLVPSMAIFGRLFKTVPGIKTCPPINYVNYNVVFRDDTQCGPVVEVACEQ